MLFDFAGSDVQDVETHRVVAHAGGQGAGAHGVGVAHGVVVADDVEGGGVTDRVVLADDVRGGCNATTANTPPRMKKNTAALRK